MNRENDQGQLVPIAAALLIGVPLLLVYLWSRSLGADFTTLLSAIGKTVLVAMTALAFWYVARLAWTALSGCLALSWLCWWPVLDSVARGGVVPDAETLPFKLMYPQHWWNTSEFRYGFFIALAAATVFVWRWERARR